MTRIPSYPEEAPVGRPAGQPDQDENVPAPENRSGEPKRTRRIVTGAAIGIGSAALVAALLYANRSRKAENGRKRDD